MDAQRDRAGVVRRRIGQSGRMKKTSKPKRTHSVDAIERMRSAALARYDSQAAQSHERVRHVMQAIQQEMAANEGIYPHNKGAVSMARSHDAQKYIPLLFTSRAI